MSTSLAKRALTNSIMNPYTTGSSGSKPSGPGEVNGKPMPRNNSVAPIYKPPKSIEKGGPFRPDLQVRLICKNCQIDPPNIVEETANGDLVCGDCGLVLGDRVVDTRSEWRTFANDEGPDASRVGNAPGGNQLLEGIEDFTTEINFRDGQTGMAKALQRTQSKILGAKASLSRDTGFRLIQDFCDKINVNRVISDTAKQIFLRTEEVKEITGLKSQFGRGPRAADAVAGTCIYLACKHNRLSRSMKEICELCHLEKRDLAYSLKAITTLYKEDLLSGKIVVNQSSNSGPPTRATDMLPRFCHRLGLEVKMESAARYVVDTAYRGTLGMVDGRSPISVAAGAIYFICMLFGLPKTTKDVQDVAQVSEGTIRLIAKIFVKYSEMLVDKAWVSSFLSFSFLV